MSQAWVEIVRERRWLGLIVLQGLAACGGGGQGAADLFPLDVATDVAVVDIDGDGRSDVLTLEQYAASSSQREGRLHVRRRNADGTFATAELYVVSTYPWRMLCVDLDGDGALDVLVTDPEAGRAFWLRQQASDPGHLLAAAELASGVAAYDVVAADFNGDGAKDVVLSDDARDSPRIMVLYQDPARPGTFRAPVDVVVPSASDALAVGDLDRDGRPDLVAWLATRESGSTAGEGTLAYTLQQAGGGFGSFTTVATRRGLNCTRLATGAYFGTGDVALLAYLTPQDSGYTAEIVVSPRDPSSGSFSSLTGAVLSGVEGIDDAAFGDLDADGQMDAAVTGFFPDGSQVKSRLNRLRQKGDGSLQPLASDSLPFSASRIALGDLNGDGRNDIVVYGANNETRALLQSQTTPGQFGPPKPL